MDSQVKGTHLVKAITSPSVVDSMYLVIVIIKAIQGKAVATFRVTGLKVMIVLITVTIKVTNH